MYAKSITIENFRVFQEKFTLNLSKNINCISGHNGIGKSTILAILSNCGEVKAKDGRMLDGSIFKGDFSEILKGDKEYDNEGAYIKIEFEDLPLHESNPPYVEALEFRTTFQKYDDKERFRLLPKKISGVRNSEAKINWPTFYLGLSRLYPIGESQKIQKSKHLSEEIAQTFIEKHALILSMNYGETASAKELGIIEHRKSKIGLKTEKFSETANSSGQDNIGQILLAILSFENLKNSYSNYSGGLLIIDELDATLHPAVQKKLFDYLLEKSLELDLQVVFTTHSLTLIQHASMIRNKNTNSEKIKVSYLRKRTNSVHVIDNPSPSVYERDLNDTYAGLAPIINKVKVITEDGVAQWFIKIILETKLNGQNELHNLEFLDLNTSWQHIIKLLTCDVEVFKNYIAILDPDIMKPDNLEVLSRLIMGSPYKVNQPLANILTIPSANDNFYNIERMLWEYIREVKDSHEMFNDPVLIDSNFQHRLALENGPESENYAQYGTKKYKKWFEDHLFLLKTVVRYWIKDNDDIVMIFLNNLKSTYNNINGKING